MGGGRERADKGGLLAGLHISAASRVSRSSDLILGAGALTYEGMMS